MFIVVLIVPAFLELVTEPLGDYVAHGCGECRRHHLISADDGEVDLGGDLFEVSGNFVFIGGSAASRNSESAQLVAKFGHINSLVAGWLR